MGAAINDYDVCFGFLRLALGIDEALPAVGETSWRSLLAFAQRQALVGVLSRGLERLPEGCAPPPAVVLKFVAGAAALRRSHVHLNQVSGEVYRQFAAAGFRCCLLKGQGSALLYDDPSLRTPGDVDLWLAGYEDAGAACYPSSDTLRRRVIPYLRQHYPIDKIRCHHALFYSDKVPVEVHFRLSEDANPYYNRHLCRWAQLMSAEQCNHLVTLPDDGGTVAVPTVSFNVVYHLQHLHRHFFDMGIGLRHIVDYWYVLRHYASSPSRDDAALCRTLRYLGLSAFAAAVLWVLTTTLSLPEDSLFLAPDARRGRQLLSEILNAGNFGRSDTKYGGITRKGIAGKYVAKTCRNLSFVRSYPTESLCEPFYRTFHFFLRHARRW